MEQALLVPLTGSAIDSRSDRRLETVAASIDACRLDVVNVPLVSEQDCLLMIAAVEADLDRRPNAEQAVELARNLLGAFGRIEAHDPDRFVHAIAGMIMSFPLSIVTELADPVRGMPSTNKPAPNSPAEVRYWCDRLLLARKSLKWKAIAIQKERERRAKMAADDAIFQQALSPDEIERRKKVAAMARDRLANKVHGGILEDD